MRSIFFMVILAATPLGAGVRDFSRPLTLVEEMGINYLITTLSSHSIITLAFYQKSLEREGAKIQQVHPLRFFQYVLTNPKLKGAMRRISSIAWKHFAEGMASNLQKAADRENLTPEMISHFSKETGIAEDVIATELQHHQWYAFLNTVRASS